LQQLAENLAAVRRSIHEAALRAHRNPSEITLLGVTKTVGPDVIREAIRLGLTDLGENRVQEAVAKMDELAEYPANWHLIGQLQTNKVKYVLGRVHLIHSLDRLSLAREIQKRSARAGIVTDCLVEVNIAGEASKAGLAPDEVEEFVQTVVSECPQIRIRGLMTVAPYEADPEKVRPCFRQMRMLAGQLRELPGVSMEHLSMGMSNDYPIAIAEGATIVRVGTAIFGRRES
jgi:pyridoxal phosphate enzyme (YggS family)